MPRFIGAIDQGTTSTRFILFDSAGLPVASAQKEHKQHFPASGWVEHDAEEIWACTESVIAEALSSAGATAADVAAVGITNQRETLVVWDASSGKPFMNAIVWQDQRGAELCTAMAKPAHVRACTCQRARDRRAHDVACTRDQRHGALAALQCRVCMRMLLQISISRLRSICMPCMPRPGPFFRVVHAHASRRYRQLVKAPASSGPSCSWP
jgi:hypothetical protein